MRISFKKSRIKFFQMEFILAKYIKVKEMEKVVEYLQMGKYKNIKDNLKMIYDMEFARQN